MSLYGVIAALVLSGGMTGLGILMWGVLRMQGRLNWRLEQWESATPRRRRGIWVGSPAPGFALPDAGRGRVCLRDFVGRKVLLVFGDDARDILPELRRIRRGGEFQVLLVQNAPATARF